MEQIKIGMFDSGVGGLSVAREFFRQLPDLPLVYLADSAHVPYGDRSPEELVELGDAIVRRLRHEGAGWIVAACNTSSAVSLPILRKRYPEVPMIGMIEPGARAAVAATRNGRIGLLATQVTVRSGAYVEAIRRIAPEAVVVSQAAPLLVPLVEAGRLHDRETQVVLESYLEPLLNAQVDTVLLGCTHYPFLLPAFRRIVGGDISLVDPAASVIAELRSRLGRESAGSSSNGVSEGWAPPSTNSGAAKLTSLSPDRLRLLTTGDARRLAAAVHLLLGRPAPAVEQVELPVSSPSASRV